MITNIGVSIMVILWLVLLAQEQEKTEAGSMKECRFIGVYTCAEMLITGFVTVEDSGMSLVTI